MNKFLSIVCIIITLGFLVLYFQLSKIKNVVIMQTENYNNLSIRYNLLSENWNKLIAYSEIKAEFNSKLEDSSGEYLFKEILSDTYHILLILPPHICHPCFEEIYLSLGENLKIIKEDHIIVLSHIDVYRDFLVYKNQFNIPAGKILIFETRNLIDSLDQVDYPIILYADENGILKNYFPASKDNLIFIKDYFSNTAELIKQNHNNLKSSL